MTDSNPSPAESFRDMRANSPGELFGIPRDWRWVLRPTKYRIRKRYSRKEKKAMMRDGIVIRRIWQHVPSWGVTITGVSP